MPLWPTVHSEAVLLLWSKVGSPMAHCSESGDCPCVARSVWHDRGEESGRRSDTREREVDEDVDEREDEDEEDEDERDDEHDDDSDEAEEAEDDDAERKYPALAVPAESVVAEDEVSEKRSWKEWGACRADKNAEGDMGDEGESDAADEGEAGDDVEDGDAASLSLPRALQVRLCVPAMRLCGGMVRRLCRNSSARSSRHPGSLCASLSAVPASSSPASCSISLRALLPASAAVPPRASASSSPPTECPGPAPKCAAGAPEPRGPQCAGESSVRGAAVGQRGAAVCTRTAGAGTGATMSIGDGVAAASWPARTAGSALSASPG